MKVRAVYGIAETPLKPDGTSELEIPTGRGRPRLEILDAAAVGGTDVQWRYALIYDSTAHNDA